MASISAAGAAGPESQYPGYAPVFNALSGMGHLTGYPDAPPTELRDSIDSRVGATTAFALLASLLHRRRTGQGQFIDLSFPRGYYGLWSGGIDGVRDERTGSPPAGQSGAGDVAPRVLPLPGRGLLGYHRRRQRRRVAGVLPGGGTAPMDGRPLAS